MTSTTIETGKDSPVPGPVGWRFVLLAVSLAKRALAINPMTAGERLEFLERLADLGDGQNGITAAAVAAVAPADAIGAKIMCEAMKLDGPEARGLGAPEAARLLSGEEQFGVLMRLNPSLLAALKLCGRGHS